MVKKAILISLLFLTCIVFPINASAVNISIPNTQEYSGALVQIPINIDHAEALGGFQMTITYDPAMLQVTGVNAGDVSPVPPWILSADTDNPGEIKIGAFDSELSGSSALGGSMVNLLFDSISAQNISSYISISDIKLSDIYGNEIFLTNTTGQRIPVTSLVPGIFHSINVDNDGDGIADDVDNEPELYNPDQDDNDEDGIGDNLDNCDGSFPIKIERGAEDYIGSSLQDAYSAALNGETIMVQYETLYQDLIINDPDKSVTIEGGYDCDFNSNPTGMTQLKGEISSTADAGPITLKNIYTRYYSALLVDCDDLTGNESDYDNDGIADACDACPDVHYDTDPECDRDTDGDGIPDSYEIEHGLNRSDPFDANIDSDGDGLTNLQEYELGTDPHDPDSNDNDIPDGDEYCSRLSDSDGDGYWDPGNFDGACIVDNCPYIPNDQTDTDQDGAGDACDNCSGMSNSGQDDADNDGIGDMCDTCTDTDGDGFGNPGFSNSCMEDNCQYSFNHDQTDTDQDGRSDACDVCVSVLPIKVGTTGYSTLQAAYNAAPSGETIMVQGDIFYENLDANLGKTIILEGGYDCDFQIYVTDSVMVGELTTSQDDEITISGFSFRTDCDGDDCETLPIAELDSDGDTIVDALDPCIYVTDPACDMDTDGDGIPDSYEIAHGLNRYDPNDAGLDKDKDGYTNLQEYLMGLAADDPDTDRDGTPDGPDNCPVLWTDNQMSAGTTLIRASHFIELRNIISYLRFINGLPPADWHYPLPAPNSSIIHAEDITDLRSAIEGVIGTHSWSEPVVPNETPIKKIHIDELRQVVSDACQ